ncbi:MAG: hypothetical protein MUC88_01625 [Planctomycetes bacterium]|jgi:hypothetical protein|nr:hypothetical protein [Planctomycetota bacterium]
MVRFAWTGNHAFVFTDYYRFNGPDPALGTTQVQLPDSPQWDEGNCIGYCFLYSREVRGRIGDHDLSTRLVEDYGYWIRISQLFPLAHLNEPLYLARFHGRSPYATRYREVGLLDLLLRLQYGLLDRPEVGPPFLNLIATKRGRLRRVRMAFLRPLLGARVDRLLKGFQAGQVDLAATRARLPMILQRWPI